jgi:hypothetical protein
MRFFIGKWSENEVFWGVNGQKMRFFREKLSKKITHLIMKNPILVYPFYYKKTPFYYEKTPFYYKKNQKITFSGSFRPKKPIFPPVEAILEAMPTGNGSKDSLLYIKWPK